MFITTSCLKPVVLLIHLLLRSKINPYGLIYNNNIIIMNPKDMSSAFIFFCEGLYSRSEAIELSEENQRRYLSCN